MDNPLTTQAVSDSAHPSEQDNAVYQKATWRDFIQLTKPGIISSNLITAFGGFWLASAGRLDWLLMLYMLAGTSLVMASGCVLNNYLDRDMDMRMERTKERALPSGRLKPSLVLWYGVLLGVAGLSVLHFLVNPLSALLGLSGLFVYVWVYTAWLKRTSPFSTSVGGISGAMPPVIGYCAVTGVLDMGALILFAILFLWQPPHFWALGIRRKEEYRAAGFAILPVVSDNHTTKIHMVRYTVMLVPVSLLLYLYGYVGIIYMISATVLGMIWVVMCVAGFRAKDDSLWARRTFLFSINYLMLMFLIIVLDTVYK